MVSTAEMVYNGQAMTFQDTSLVGAAQEGSRWAFEQLFRAHEKRIYSLALHMVGDPSIAEDLTQDTFVRAWENLGRLRHEQAFGGWLRRIALNLIWDHIRTRKPEDELDDEAAERLPEGGRTAHEELERQRMARKVQAAVMSLPEHQRVVLAMFYWEDLPVNDIAATLSIARGTVISRLARGRDTLRRKLGPAVSEPPGVS